MSNPTSKFLDPDGYEAIESALLASGRGRSFLAEHARRQRARGNLGLLDAICRLEDVIRDSHINARVAEALAETRQLARDIRVELHVAVEEAGSAAARERLARTLPLLEALEGRLATLVALTESEEATECGRAATPRERNGGPSPSAAASLLRKLQAMTPEERRALFR